MTEPHSGGGLLATLRRRAVSGGATGENAFVRALADGRQWADRSVMLGFAVATGLVVVAFTLLAEAASATHQKLTGSSPWGPYAGLVWTPLLTVAVLAWTRRFAPGAQGSGIPQVVRALEPDLDEHRRSWLVSWRVSLHKVGLVSAGMLAGLSIGREGPTVQVGAGVMSQARRWLSKDSGIDAHDLMVAGAAAGIAAAFNTPLGGIVFALEQLTRRRHMSHSALVITSIVAAGLVAVSVFGNETYLGGCGCRSSDGRCSRPGWWWPWPVGWPAGSSRGCSSSPCRGCPTASRCGGSAFRCALPPPAPSPWP